MWIPYCSQTNSVILKGCVIPLCIMLSGAGSEITVFPNWFHLFNKTHIECSNLHKAKCSLPPVDEVYETLCSICMQLWHEGIKTIWISTVSMNSSSSEQSWLLLVFGGPCWCTNICISVRVSVWRVLHQALNWSLTRSHLPNGQMNHGFLLTWPAMLFFSVLIMLGVIYSSNALQMILYLQLLELSPTSGIPLPK